MFLWLDPRRLCYNWRIKVIIDCVGPWLFRVINMEVNIIAADAQAPGVIKSSSVIIMSVSLHWRHNGRDSVSNLQPHDCLLNRLFRDRSKKTSKLRVSGLCMGKLLGTGEFPAQMASNAEMFPFDDASMHHQPWYWMFKIGIGRSKSSRYTYHNFSADEYKAYAFLSE